MIKGFKDFLLRGNVVDLAVAVVIGAAFTAVVTAVTRNLIEPLINVFGGNTVNGLGFQILSGNPKTVVDIGAILTAAINFVVVAAVVYFLVVTPLNRLQEMRKRGDAPIGEVPIREDVALLAEIRDLLAAQNGERPHRSPGL